MTENGAGPVEGMMVADRLRRIGEIKEQMDQIAQGATADDQAEARLVRFHELAAELRALDAYNLFPALQGTVGIYGSDLFRHREIALVERARKTKERLKARH